MNTNSTDNYNRDVETVRLIRAGDRSAFVAFYDRCAGLLLSVAVRVLGDRAEAEDVVQEVFAQIWRKSDSYNPALGTLASWLVTLTRNKAIDRVRALTRRLRLVEELAMAADPIADGQALTANELLHGKERAQAIRGAVSQLPEEQRHAIELAFFAGLSQAEIATRLQQPLGTIKARIRRGMLRLRGQLQGAQ